MYYARTWRQVTGLGAIVLLVAHALVGTPAASAPIDDASLQTIRDSLDAQLRRLQEQEQALEQQRRELDTQRQKLIELERQLGGPGAAEKPQTDKPPATAGAPVQPAPAKAPGAGTPPAPAKAGEAAVTAATTRPKQDEQRPAVNLLADVGGVLTPKGRFVLEPELEYGYDTQSRFFFNGVEVIDSILVGQIQITDAQRRTLSTALNLRYGITNRFEVDTRLPFIYADDKLTRQEVATGNQITDSSDNANLGDIEFGAHYQLNRGQGGWPYFVGNFRVKSNTGEGPFEIDAEDDVATGSGFWAIEPSLTVIYPSDPAVLFANIGYVHSFGEDVSKTYTATGGNRTRIGQVDPGASVRASFGVGIALNEALSMSIGYEHNWIGGVDQEFEVAPPGGAFGSTQHTQSDSFEAGSLLFGLSYALSPKVGINLNLAAGVTDEAPDARISVRVPISFDLFD